MKSCDVETAAKHARSYAEREGLTCVGVTMTLDASNGSAQWTGSFVTPDLAQVIKVVLS